MDCLILLIPLDDPSAASFNKKKIYIQKKRITMDNHSAAEFVELIEKNNGIHNFPQKAP